MSTPESRFQIQITLESFEKLEISFRLVHWYQEKLYDDKSADKDLLILSLLEAQDQ